MTLTSNPSSLSYGGVTLLHIPSSRQKNPWGYV